MEILFTRFVILFLVFVGFNNSASASENIYRFSCTKYNGVSRTDLKSDDGNYHYFIGDLSMRESFLRSCIGMFNFVIDGEVLIGSKGEIYAFVVSSSGVDSGYRVYLTDFLYCSASDSACQKKYCEENKNGIWDEQTKTCKEKEIECGKFGIYNSNAGKCVPDCSKSMSSSAYNPIIDGEIVASCVSDACKAKDGLKVTKNWNELIHEGNDAFDKKSQSYVDSDGCYTTCDFVKNNSNGGEYSCEFGNVGVVYLGEITELESDPECRYDPSKGEKPKENCVYGASELEKTTDEKPNQSGSGSNPDGSSGSSSTSGSSSSSSNVGAKSGSISPKDSGAGFNITNIPTYINIDDSGGGDSTGGGGSTTGGGGSGSGTGSGTGSGSGSGSGTGDGDGKGDGDGNGETVDGDFDGEFGNPEKTDIPEAPLDIAQLFEKYRKDYFRFSRSCPTSVQIDIFGQVKTINIDILCKFGDFLRLILHITAYIILLKLLSSSLTQKT